MPPDDFYPGSTRRVNSGEEAPREYTGKFFTINGTEHELFTSGELAFALNRKPTTIRRWEREGLLPKALFVKQGKSGDVRGRRRLYSRAQVDGLVEIMRETDLLDNPRFSITRTPFSIKAHALFKELGTR